MSSETLFGVGLRLLALVQLCAFASLWRDLPALAGSRGIYPVADVATRMRLDFGGRRLLYAPSLLHFAHSDRALRAWPLVGAAAAGLALLGVPGSPLWFLVAWAVYLSLDLAVDLFYPWDALLLEAGLLAVLAPPLLPLPAVAVAAAPHALLAFAFRFLAFRIVFGFGKFKFFGPGRFASGYLRQFMVTQPLPRPLGLRLTRLPLPLHQVALAGLFLVEIVLPWLWLGPPALRIVPSLATALLMLGIQLTGNFGFFNVGMLPLVVLSAAPLPSCFDVAPASPCFIADAPHLAAVALVALGLLHLPFNSWVARAWVYWPSLQRIAERRLGGLLSPLLALLRGLAPFHLVHAYGVFSPQSGPAVQWIPVFEGSRDGVRFEPYRYRYFPSDDQFRGVRIAPAFPRFDHSIIYEAMGLGLGNLFGGVVGGGHPYRASAALYFERVARRLLEGSPEVRSLFHPWHPWRASPLGDQPPVAVRVSLHLHVWSDGRFVAHRVGEHLPAMTLASTEPLDAPLPEAFLFDERIWTRRALGRLDPAAELATSETRDLFTLLADIGAAALVASPPAESLRCTPALSPLLARADALRPSLRAVERAAFRLAWALRVRSAPLPGEGELELGMRCLRVVVAGRAAVAAALADSESGPGRAIAAYPLDEAIAAFALFRPNWVRFHARKAALREVTLRGTVASPPSFAPSILRLSTRLSSLFPDPSLRLPRFIPDPVRGFVVGAEPPPGLTAAT